MKYVISLMVSMLFMVSALAEPKWDNRWEKGHKLSCKRPFEATLEVHSTYLDDKTQTLMCGVEVESYSWWDLIGESYDQGYSWFPCHAAGPSTKEGSWVRGILSWEYSVSCHRCKPGRYYTCEARFHLGLESKK